MASPTIDNFLTEIARILREKNGTQLQAYLLLEPPLPQLYQVIVSELQRSFSTDDQDALESKCKQFIPEHEDGDRGGSWLSFITLLAKYFIFLRDVDVDDLLKTHEMLQNLLKLVN